MSDPRDPAAREARLERLRDEARVLAADSARVPRPPRPEPSAEHGYYGEPILKAAIHLTDPGALYARQRQRTWWFVALVLVAAATAGVGLFSAHRAFQRQLRLNELKTNFVSSVSHELRAPIASVRLLAESLDRGTVTDEARRREYFQLMGQECRRLSALIENVVRPRRTVASVGAPGSGSSLTTRQTNPEQSKPPGAEP